MPSINAILSPDNPKFKTVARLLKSRGWQDRGRIAIFGFREVTRAISSGLPIEEVFVCRSGLSPELLNRVNDLLAAVTTPVWELTERLFDKLAYGERRDGILAIASRPDVALDSVRLSSRPLIVVMESIEKPGNIGAVARSADAVGADALILADPVCDLFHPNCIRASMGSIFKLRTGIAAAGEVRQWLVGLGISIIAARVDARQIYWDNDWTRGTAIVLGSEANGLSSIWSGSDVADVRLPMRGSADSLNVSVSAAVLMFEAARQRQSAPSDRIRTATGGADGDSGR